VSFNQIVAPILILAVCAAVCIAVLLFNRRLLRQTKVAMVEWQLEGGNVVDDWLDRYDERVEHLREFGEHRDEAASLRADLDAEDPAPYSAAIESCPDRALRHSLDTLRESATRAARRASDGKERRTLNALADYSEARSSALTRLETLAPDEEPEESPERTDPTFSARTRAK
jgi:hypothetical protein